MQISVVGLGYVGLSLATLISRKYNVTAVDVIQDKVDMINAHISPLYDVDIQKCLSESKLDLTASTDISICNEAEFIIIATPTNYDTETNKFDTSSIESTIRRIEMINPTATVVIKSTVPIGYTEHISEKMNNHNIIFSPEFLREGRALYDNLHPSRIIVGIPNNDERLRERGNVFLEILKDCALDEDVSTMLTGSTEAESIKLFSNSYLAMRVAFFNELDSFAECNDLSSEEIIRGVCLDPRIENQYNNPSFGYGGYCLPKDTKQLLSNYYNVPNSIIKAIVQSNDIRKNYIASRIIEKTNNDPTKIIGVYKITMKFGSDNYRESSIMQIVETLKTKGYETIIYEPTCKDGEYMGNRIVNNLADFKQRASLILANRMSNDLTDVTEKVYCRDIFNRD